jgi:uroporphyrinogen decarboxylase
VTSRERVLAALRQQEVDRLPRQLWALPGVPRYRAEEHERLLERFPPDIMAPPYRYGVARRFRGEPNEVGEYVDAWGSVWRVAEPGVVGEVKRPPLDSWEALERYQLPWELLEEADLSEVERFCGQTDSFVLAGTETRPFERMQFLRGTENLFLDLASGEGELYRLRDMLHEFSLEEMRLWARTAVDGVSFMDDWGTQRGLLISPDLWRRLFKPLYRDYCALLHAGGKLAFFHSDGNIEAIYPDLIEIGVDAVNSQLFCMDIEALGRLYAGRITFWGEIDRQRILSFGTPEQVRQAVDRVARALLPGRRTGVIAQCEWGLKDPMENIAAVFEQWGRY